MLFLIDFFKKRMWTFSLFSDFFPHYVCAVSPSNLTSCPLPPLNHNCIFKREKKKVNKRTIRSVFHFLQAFIWMVRVCDGCSHVLFYYYYYYFLNAVHTAHPRTCRVQLLCFTVAVSTPCNSNFGDFFFLFFTFSYQLILCFSTGKKKKKFFVGYYSSWAIWGHKLSYNSLDELQTQWHRVKSMTSMTLSTVSKRS